MSDQPAVKKDAVCDGAESTSSERSNLSQQEVHRSEIGSGNQPQESGIDRSTLESDQGITSAEMADVTSPRKKRRLKEVNLHSHSPFSSCDMAHQRNEKEEDENSSALSSKEQDGEDQGGMDVESQQKPTSVSNTVSDGEKRTPEVGALQFRWQKMFERLVLFQKKHGHCLVPNRYEGDKSLGAWVSTQRRHFKMMSTDKTATTPLTTNRIKKLEEIGFVWATSDPRHTPWEVRFEELREYKDLHGNCLVPIGFKDNVQLANWVSTQRQDYKALSEGRPSRLTEERIQMLNSIGMVWDAQRGGNRQRGRYKPIKDSPKSESIARAEHQESSLHSKSLRPTDSDSPRYAARNKEHDTKAASLLGSIPSSSIDVSLQLQAPDSNPLHANQVRATRAILDRIDPSLTSLSLQRRLYAAAAQPAMTIPPLLWASLYSGGVSDLEEVNRRSTQDSGILHRLAAMRNAPEPIDESAFMARLGASTLPTLEPNRFETLASRLLLQQVHSGIAAPARQTSLSDLDRALMERYLALTTDNSTMNRLTATTPGTFGLMSGNLPTSLELSRRHLGALSGASSIYQNSSSSLLSGAAINTSPLDMANRGNIDRSMARNSLLERALLLSRSLQGTSPQQDLLASTQQRLFQQGQGSFGLSGGLRTGSDAGRLHGLLLEQERSVNQLGVVAATNVQENIPDRATSTRVAYRSEAFSNRARSNDRSRDKKK